MEERTKITITLKDLGEVGKETQTQEASTGEAADDILQKATRYAKDVATVHDVLAGMAAMLYDKYGLLYTRQDGEWVLHNDRAPELVADCMKAIVDHVMPGLRER